MALPAAARGTSSRRKRAPSKRPRRKRRLAKVSLGLTLATLVLAPLAAGGVHRPALVGLSLLAMAAAILLAASEWRGGRRFNVSPAALFPGAFLVLTASQLIPLPPALAALLDPQGTILLSEGGGWQGGWRPLTLDPPATVQALIRSAVGLLMFLASYHVASRRTGPSWILRAIAATGVVAVLIGLGHRLFGFSTIYGLFANGRHAALLVGPFINANHTAEFLELAAFTAIACARQSATSLSRIGWYSAAVTSAAGALVTLSRSSVFALGIGVAVVVLGRATERPNVDAAKVPGRRGWLPVLIGLTAVGVVAVSIGAGQLLDRFRANSLASDMRLGVWRDSLAILKAHPLGIGREAFDVTYPIYRTLEIGRPVRFSFLENEPLQMLIDFGYVGFALLLVSALLPLRALLKHGRRDGVETALLAGLLAVFAHSFTDFGLETLGVLLPFVCVLATMLGRIHSSPSAPGSDPTQTATTTPTPTEMATVTATAMTTATATVSSVVAPLRRPASVRPLALIALVSLICLTGLFRVARAGGRDFDSELKAAVGAHEKRELLWAARRAHPLDYYYPLVLSSLEPLSPPNGGPSPRLRALNQALRLCMNCADVHLQVARTMWRLGKRTQALGEWTMAARNQSALFRRSLDELTTLGAQPLELARLAEDKPQRMLELAEYLLLRPHPERAGPIIEQAAALGASDLDVALLSARMNLATSKDPVVTGKSVERARSLAPDDARVALLEAQFIMQQPGKEAASTALSVVERALDRSPSDLDLQRKRIEIVNRYERWSAADRSIVGYKQALQELGRSTVEANMAAANIYMTLGRVRDAMTEYRIATTADPDNAGLWRQFAASAESARYLVMARDAYSEVMRIAPDKQVSDAIRRIDDAQAAERLGTRKESGSPPLPRGGLGNP